MVEAIVAISLIGLMMAALTPFFINSLAVTDYQRTKQVAIQLAGDAVERARALKGSALLAGRGQLRSTDQWTNAPAPVRPYLDSLTLAWDTDPLLEADVGSAAPLPTAPVTAQVSGKQYQQHWYVGRCRQQGGRTGGAQRPCEPVTTADPDPARPDVSLFGLVVAVTWQHKLCPAHACTYVSSTFFSNANDPVFNSKRPPPSLIPVDQYSYVGVPTNVQLTASGGQLPLSWTVSGLPAGLTLASAASGVVSGTPGAEGSFPVTVTVTDRQGDSDTTQFRWHVGRRPVLADPGGQVSSLGEPVEPLSLGTFLTGGFADFSWAATGLPAGLAIDPASGVIRGTPSSLGNYPTVRVTVTDRTRTTTSVEFAWRIVPLAAQDPGAQSTPMGTTVDDFGLAVTGGTGPYTWRADNLPAGLTIGRDSGLISGTVVSGTRYLTTVYVKDVSGHEVTVTFPWDVPPAKNNDMRITTPVPEESDQSSVVGRALSLAVAADKGSNSGYTWQASGLPRGLSVATTDRSECVISGTPQTPGVYRVRVVAVDSNKKVAVLMFTWTVTP